MHPWFSLPRLLVGLCLMLGLAVPSLAQPKPGPLDGAAVESLTPLATPTLTAEEKMLDFSLPIRLEKAGDDLAAQLEWQRLLPQASGPERELVLWRLALVQQRNQPFGRAAAHTWQQLWNDYPLSPRLPVVLYQLIQLHVQAAPAVQATLPPLTELTTQTQALPANNTWRQAALLSLVAAEARRTGTVTQPYNLLPAGQLRQQLVLHAANQQKFATQAIIAGVIPGGGHLWQQNYAAGSAIFLLTLIFLWAFSAACAHRHYAYAMVWALPAFGLWLSSPFNALALAQQHAQQQQTRLIQQWQHQWLTSLPPLPNLSALLPTLTGPQITSPQGHSVLSPQS